MPLIPQIIAKNPITFLDLTRSNGKVSLGRKSRLEYTTLNRTTTVIIRTLKNMSQSPATNYSQRHLVAEELADRFSRNANFREKAIFWRKRVLWDGSIFLVRACKRLVDIIVALFGLILLSPLMITVAILIKLEDPKGSVFFFQTRVGRWGREFPFPKFRSMVHNAEEIKQKLSDQNQHGDSITFKMKRDPRITRVGRVIRRLSIDELPQLFSVLIGHMTLVGPRPALPNEVAQYKYEDRRRLEAKPGITCLWQISGRGDIPFDQQVELDEQYIQSQGIWNDIKILAKTIPAVLTGKGAY